MAVALEVLRRNDEDPHAACEMLEEFRQRIRRNVTEEWDQYLLQGEEGELFFFGGGDGLRMDWCGGKMIAKKQGVLIGLMSLINFFWFR